MKLSRLSTALLLLLMALAAGRAGAQELGSEGTEFLFSFPTNYASGSSSVPYIRLYITAPVRTRVRVYAGANLKATLYTVPDEIVTQDLTKAEGQAVDREVTDPLPDDAIYRGKAVRVVADAPVTISGLNLTQYSVDGMSILPTSALGRRYIVATATDVAPEIQRLPSQFVIAAAHDSTIVEITPTWNTPNHTAGESYTIRLDKGDLYSAMSRGTGGDLSGSLITATKPVAVMAGNTCTQLPDNRYPACDYLAEMLMPTEAWGLSYHSVPFATRTKGDYHRIFASEPNTDIYINGVKVADLTTAGGQKGSGWIDFLPPERAVLDIRASKPILVAQYNNSQTYDGAKSDPFMIALTPVEQFRTSFTFSTPAVEFPNNYLTVVTDSAGYAGIEVRRGSSTIWEPLSRLFVGTPRAFTSTIGGRRYVGLTMEITPGVYTMRGPLPFTAYVYGLSTFASYGYPAGMGTRVLATTDATPPAITSTADCRGTVDAVVVDPSTAGAPSAGIATIELLAESANVELAIDSLEVGVSRRARYHLLVIDRATTARAIVRIIDRAGNAAYDTSDYAPFGVTASPASIVVGPISIGQTEDRSLMLSNVGSTTVTVTAIRLAAGDQGFSITGPTSGFTLAPGEQQSGAIRFSATARGVFVDTLILVDACGPWRVVPLRATVGQASIEVTDVDFGAWPVTSPPSVRAFEIRNTSSEGYLTVTGTSDIIDDAVVFTLPRGLPVFPLTIAPQSSETIVVAFAPTAAIDYLDSIVFSHDGAAGPGVDATAVLRGSGLASAVRASSLDFGTLVVSPTDKSRTGEVTITNSGTEPVVLAGIASVSGDSTAFRFPNAENFTGVSVAPGVTWPIPVIFEPRSHGDFRMEVRWRTTPDAGPVVSVLTGTAIIPDAAPLEERLAAVAIDALMPNPAAGGHVIISYRSNGRPADFTLIRSNGVIVREWRERAGTTSTSVDLESVEAGMYLVRMRAGEVGVVRRIVVR